MTPALLRSPRPFCAYCDTGLREVCPTRRAIAAGLPGMRGVSEAAIAREVLLFEMGRPRDIPRAELFKAYRAAGCDLMQTARTMKIPIVILMRSLDKDTRASLNKIKKASRENG